MRILMISDGDYKYGASHSMVSLIKNLSYTGNDISVVGVFTEGYKRYAEELRYCGCKCVYGAYHQFYQNIPYEKWKRPLKYIVRLVEYRIINPLFIRLLERKIDFSCVDIIHSNTNREDIGAILSRKHGIPLIIHLREFGDKDYNCYTYRKDYIEFMNSHAAKFIAISDAVKDHWIKKGINADKIVKIYNGIDLVEQVKQVPMEDYCKNNRHICRCVIIGSLTEAKGHSEIIRALGYLKQKSESVNIHVDFIGDGKKAFSKLLKTEVKKMNLDNIISFKGYIDNPAKELPKYDIGLMCSRSEGFGRVTVEYMMAGIPVIASDTGANPELIRNGTDGLLYKYGDYRALAWAIKKLAENSDERQSMGINAQKRARSMFTADLNAKRILELYRTVINDTRISGKGENNCCRNALT